MRNRLPLTPLALTLGLLAPAVGRAQVTLVETVNYVPTSVVAVPRTYYLPTGYVGTSAALVTSPTTTVYDVRPTSYEATSYYVPTAYYYRRPFWRNRYVRTSYLYEPTVYVAPSYYVAPATYVAGSAVTTSSLCCPASSPVVMAPARSAQVDVEPAASRRAGGTIESSVVGEPDEQVETTGSTGLRPITPTGPARGAGGTSSAVGAGATSGSSASPGAVGGASRESRPVPPVPVPSTGAGSTGAGAGAATGSPKPPLGTSGTPTPADSTSPPPRTEPDVPLPAPIPSPAGGDNPLGLPSFEDPIRRSANKPIPTLDAPRRLAQSILKGRIVSADTKLPETGVEVILVDKLGRFANRATRTDATGRFGLALPEGDWTILVTMPSGRALAVEQGLVTASAGKVSDRWGRELTNLIISR